MIIDDFTQLNEKFIKARRDYESLLEASMSQPQQPAYARPYGYNAPPAGPYAAYPPVSSPPPPQQQDPRFNYNMPPSGAQDPSSQYPLTGSGYFMVPSSHLQPQRPQQQTPKPSQPPNDPYAVPSQGRVPAARVNSYVPQELATGYHDSPVDNQQSFTGQGHIPGVPSGGPQFPTEYAHQGISMPLSQGQAGQAHPMHTPYEPISSPYQGQQVSPPQDQPSAPEDMYPNSYVGYPPPEPNHGPPAPPGQSASPPPGAAPQGGYLAYRPGGAVPSAVPNAPVGGGADEGFYR